jgi:uncharacterized protein YegP (UPF0339 family)
MGKFEIVQRKNNEFQFNLKANNAQIILTSEGYTTKAACNNGIQSVKENAQIEERFNRLESQNGKPYFTLVAGNGHVIGTSEVYESEASRDNGIESVMKNAPKAIIYDLT